MSLENVGRYQIRGEIGRGGMAIVYRALDPNSNREVAIKLLPREMMFDQKFRERFRRELRTISLLEHPSIVPVYDSGEHDGQPYFVMRYMTGGSLRKWLEAGRLSLRETAEIIERLALGLDYSHQKGVIHRDIKPENVLFDENNNPYLSDFGVSKLAEAASSETGSAIIGTPAYASPEQAQGENKKVDQRSDVYGIGVLIYQMLTGDQPFKADTQMGVLVKHINDPVPNILDVVPNLPPVLDVIINKAMAKERDDRYQSVLELARALSVAAYGPERTIPSALILERKRVTSSVRRRRFVILGGAILVMIFAGVYLYFTPANPLNSVMQASPTSTTTITPSVISPSPTLQPPTPTLTTTPTVEPPTQIPTPNGGADQIALLSGNNIVSIDMNGRNPGVIDDQNIDKSNLQWITNHQLIYISPSHNCAYFVDTEDRIPNEILCFRPQEILEGFRVSPDGAYVAISADRTLTIVPFDTDAFDSVNTRLLFEKIENSCIYRNRVKDVRWSDDGRSIAALVFDTQRGSSDQIHIFDINYPNCASQTLEPTDVFPGNHFPFESSTIPSFEWDGNHLFLLNDTNRNDGFGNLYLYDSEIQDGKMINPINGNCCYRDARWSPDGTYILFLYKNEVEGEIMMYYVAFDTLDLYETWTPINMPPNLIKSGFQLQPVLRPAE